MARLALLLVVLAGQILLASRARAENVVVVLDGGAGAKEKASENAALATTLANRLKERGDTVRAYVVSVRANGKQRVDELALLLDDKIELTFEGRSDARVALAAALRGPAPKEPVTVVLIGPFGKVDPAPEGATQAVDAWKRAAPDGSQVIPFGLSAEAAKSLESAKGWRANGVLVLGLKDVKVQTQSWSAFDMEPQLRANIRADFDSVWWGAGPWARAPALAALGMDGDTITEALGGGLLLKRSSTGGFATTVRLLVAPEPTAWILAATGEPVPVRWVPEPEIRWLTPDSKPPRLKADDLMRGGPRTARFPYRRTGPLGNEFDKPRERPASPEFPARLRLDLEPETQEAPFIQAGAVVLTAEFVGPSALDRDTSPGDPFRTWFDVRSAPGRVHARLTAPEAPQPLPPASTDAPWELALVAENPNAPETVTLVWDPEPREGAESLVLRVRRGDAEESEWRAGEDRRFTVGARYGVRPVVSGSKPPPTEGKVVWLFQIEPGVDVAFEGEGRWRPRKPQLVVEPGEVRYRADAKDVTEEKPLRLRLGADGGDGIWLAELLERAPAVVKRHGAPQEFALTPLAPGRWELRRAGAWSGERAGIFKDREERLPVMAVWPAGGQAFEWEIPVTVPARWGRMGWVLLGLAAFAAGLGLFVVFSHRALPITGTLLYTVEGRAGAVGRLALAPVGRRAATVTADERGRLALGGPGSALIRLLPTRVGGMAEVPGPAGGTERRLLVDGLSFSVGRHALRYVQPGGQESAPRAGESSIVPGAPGGTGAGSTPAPDLLGPEYDLPHGA